jgi:hypothetical protein
MGLFDGISNLFDTAVSNVTDLFGSGDQSQSYVGGLSVPGAPVPVSYMPAYSVQPTYDVPMAQPVMSTVPQVVGGAISRGLAMYPALAAYLSRFKDRSAALNQLWSFVQKWGPSAMAAMVGAQVITDLLSYKTTHKRRRMNVANTKALRRSIRRLKGFDRLSVRVHAQLGRAAGRRRSTRRCGTCRKNPCSC